MQHPLLIKNIEQHIKLDPSEIEFLLPLFNARTIKKKEFLLQAGDICFTENFIVKGCLRLYSIDENGFEHIVMFGIEDWWMGDLYSFLTLTPSAYFIDALEETEVLQISKTSLEKLYAELPKFERFFRIKFQNAFIAQQNR
ncbi:MAG: cyclic nucleotide-binding domain-containing protein, partial [Bacteroidota bacterium]